MEKIKNIIIKAYSKLDDDKKLRTRAVFGIVAFFALYYFYYCSQIAVEVPCLTFLDQVHLADLLYKGNVRLKDIVSTYCEHGMLATNILYLINVRFFHGMQLFDTAVNDAIVLATGIIFSIMICKSIKKNAVLTVFCAMFVNFLVYQSIAIGMDVQVRLGVLFFIVAMLFVDSEFVLGQAGQKSLVRLLLTLCAIFLSVNVCGTLYSFAGVPLIFVLILCLAFKSRRISIGNIAIGLAYLLATLLYVAEYEIFDVINAESNGGLGKNFISLFTSPVNTLKVIFSWYANGVLGWSFFQCKWFSQPLWLGVGAFVFAATLFSVVLFFKFKMHQKTWLPLMCVVYAFGVMVLVYLGRFPNWEHFANEWYTVHIKLSLIASVWIFGFCFEKTKVANKATVLFVAAALAFLCLEGSLVSWKAKGAIYNYYKSKQPYLFVKSESVMPVDASGNTPLVNSLAITMDSIRILKKYNLSVYRYWDSYAAAPSAVVDANINFLSGHYSDNWISDECSFTVLADRGGRLRLSFFYPNKDVKEKRISIFVDGKSSASSQLQYGLWDCEVDVPAGASKIELQSNYLMESSNSDERRLCVILSDIKLVEFNDGL